MKASTRLSGKLTIVMVRTAPCRRQARVLSGPDVGICDPVVNPAILPGEKCNWRVARQVSIPLTCNQDVAYEHNDHRSDREERRPAGAASTSLAGADERRGVRAVVWRRDRRPVRAWRPGDR